MLYNVQMHYLSLVLWVLVSAKKVRKINLVGSKNDRIFALEKNRRLFNKE